jgi:large subunit ribosomal protein L17
MFKNMSVSMIMTVVAEHGPDNRKAAKVPGRIVTTMPKAKEFRRVMDKLVTLAKKAIPHEKNAKQFATSAKRNTSEYIAWKNSENYKKWVAAIAPAVALRRRAFSQLRDKVAVKILFEDLGPRFVTRNGGYVRVLRLAKRRLGDGGEQAIVEYTGLHDRIRTVRKAPVLETASS